MPVLGLQGIGRPLDLVRREIRAGSGAQRRELALCQPLLPPTDQTWEQGLPGHLPVSPPGVVGRKF